MHRISHLEAFIVEVPELPGCMAHGETQESALKNIQDAIDLWIDTAHETGASVPDAKCRRLRSIKMRQWINQQGRYDSLTVPVHIRYCEELLGTSLTSRITFEPM